MKKIAIVTVNYNGSKDTLELLDSLSHLDERGLEVLIVVVDNGSTDDSVEKIQREFPKVDILQTSANLGFTGGYNRGMRHSLAWGADYIFIINNDTQTPDRNLLHTLIQTLESDKKIGLVIPKILFAPGFEFHKDRYRQEEIGKVIWYAGAVFDWNNLQARHRGIDEVDRGQYNSVEKNNFTSGCCFLVKREVLEKVGLFDDSLFAYLEDVDFSRRVSEAGYKQYYDGRTAIYHKISQTAGVGSSKSDYFITRNRLVLGMRYGNRRTKFALTREAVKFLIFGREYQRKGVIDFLSEASGAPSWMRSENIAAIYPIKLSIVIVNYNTADLVLQELKSIFRRVSGFDENAMEVILLDNGTLDPCTKFINRFPGIRYLQNPENLGFTKGYNRAINYSRGEYILMLNSDIEVLPGSINEILRTTEEYRGKAVIGGKLIFPDSTSQNSCYKLPTIWGAFKAYFLKQKDSYFMYLPKTEKPTRVEGLVMACFLIPRKVLTKIGLLDEGTFMFFEDIEYSRRLRENNIPIYFDPQAKFIHHHGASTKKLKEGAAYKMLVKGAIHYHGKLRYSLISLVLLFGQKLKLVDAPIAR